MPLRGERLLLLQKRCFLVSVFLLLFKQRFKLAAQLRAFFRQLSHVTLQRVAASLVDAGYQRLVFRDRRMMFRTAQWTRRARLQAGALGFQPGDTRFQFADGFYIAELLIFFLPRLTTLL